MDRPNLERMLDQTSPAELVTTAWIAKTLSVNPQWVRKTFRPLRVLLSDKTIRYPKAQVLAYVLERLHA